MQDNRNIHVLQHILQYCREIENTVLRFGDEYIIFCKDTVYQNAVAMCVLQIGELTTHFTEEFKEEYNGMPWNQIKALRNIVAHNYGKIDRKILWETVMIDIPELKVYCEMVLEKTKKEK